MNEPIRVNAKCFYCKKPNPIIPFHGNITCKVDCKHCDKYFLYRAGESLPYNRKKDQTPSDYFNILKYMTD